MVACKHCTTLNSLDSTFCKRCGTSLPEEELKEAIAKHDQMVAEGMNLFNEGRTDEAMQVAEAAVTSNPSAIQAHSLKGMCHERMGQVAEALECYERVVALNPDSALDKIKLNHLRNLLVARTQPDPKKNRRALIVSVAAGVLLFACVGALVAVLNHRSGSGAVAQAPISADSPTVEPFPEVPTNSATAGAGTTPPGAQTPPPVTNPEVAPNSAPVQNPAADPRRTETGLPRPGVGQLPSPMEGNIAPFQPQVQITPVQQTPSRPSQDPDPTPTAPAANPGNPPGSSAEADNAEARENDPGLIDIRPSADSPRPNANPSAVGNAASGANGAQALIRAAQNQWQTGNIAGAAISYQRALQFGADPASTNQRLGMAFERLGRRSEAISAYQRAANALESRLNSGGGNRARTQATLDSVRQALKVLQGG